MIKRLALGMLTMFLVIGLSGCILDSELRPQLSENEVWVCEEPYAYFKYDSERILFSGKLAIGDKQYDFFEYESSGTYMAYLKPEAIVGDTIQSDGNTLLTGTAEYHEGYFDFTVKQDPDNLFDGELPVMRFTRYTPEEFEEKFDTLEPGEDTLS